MIFVVVWFKHCFLISQSLPTDYIQIVYVYCMYEYFLMGSVWEECNRGKISKLKKKITIEMSAESSGFRP